MFKVNNKDQNNVNDNVNVTNSALLMITLNILHILS